MATHSSVLAWRIPMAREGQRATAHRMAKSEPLLIGSTTVVTNCINNCINSFSFVPVSYWLSQTLGICCTKECVQSFSHWYDSTLSHAVRTSLMGEHWLCRHALKCQISQLFAICVTPMELSLIYIGKMMSHLFVVKPNVLKN